MVNLYVYQTWQSFYFGTIWYFTKMFFCHKWNKAWILVEKMVYTSCQAHCQKIQDLDSQEIRKFQENLKTAWIYSPVLSLPFERKILSVLVKNYLKLFYVCLKYFVHDCGPLSFSTLNIFAKCKDCGEPQCDSNTSVQKMKKYTYHHIFLV